MRQIVCPVCSSTYHKVTDCTRDQYIPFYGDLSVPIKDYFCNECGFQGDFAQENDDVFMAAHDVAMLKSVNNMIDTLNEQGVSNTEIERAMWLFPRTLNKWRVGKNLTPEAVALLRLLTTNPDLVRKPYDDRNEGTRR